MTHAKYIPFADQIEGRIPIGIQIDVNLLSGFYFQFNKVGKILMFEIEFCKDILILILLQVIPISRTLSVSIVKAALGDKRVF